MKPFSQLRGNQRQVLREVIPLKKPFSLTIDPSSICNFKCAQCLQGDEKYYKLLDKRMMKGETFAKIIDDVKAWEGPQLKVIKLYNCGEPFLNPEFPALLKYVKDADVAERIEVTSNCSLLTHSISDQLVEYGLDYLRASVYSPLQDQHEMITKSKVDIEIIYNNLSYLKKIKLKKNSQKPFVAIKMFEGADQEENKLFLAKYADVADEIFFEKLHNFNDLSGKNFIETYYGIKEGEETKKKEVAYTPKSACPWPFMTLTIQSNGDVNACCVDWLGDTKVGSIFKHSLREIWEGDALYEFRKMQLEARRSENPGCRNCTVYLTDDFTVDNIDGVSVMKLTRQT